MSGTNEKKRGTEILYGLIAQARQFDDTIIMGRGDPDFDTPRHIIDAGIDAMKQHGAEGSPVEGILPLRQAIADRVRNLNGFDIDPETEVVVTNGGQEAILLMVLAAVQPGDEVIVPEPNYNTYKDAIAFAGGVVRGIDTDPDQAFRVEPDLVRKAITDQTRALLLVSPNNPAASVIQRADMEELVQIAVDHDLTIISDDIYDLLVYDGAEHVNPASIPGGKERTFTLNALSKTYAMTGWRAGWVVGPAARMGDVRALKQAVSGPSSIITQHAALAALTGPQDDMEAMREAYVRRRKIVLESLREMGLEFREPQGGQFVFVDISKTQMGSLELAERILTEQHVLAYPGGAFSESMNQFLRMTFLQPDDVLVEGLERMQKVFRDVIPS